MAFSYAGGRRVGPRKQTFDGDKMPSPYEREARLLLRVEESSVHHCDHQMRGRARLAFFSLPPPYLPPRAAGTSYAVEACCQQQSAACDSGMLTEDAVACAARLAQIPASFPLSKGCTVLVCTGIKKSSPAGVIMPEATTRKQVFVPLAKYPFRCRPLQRRYHSPIDQSPKCELDGALAGVTQARRRRGGRVDA